MPDDKDESRLCEEGVAQNAAHLLSCPGVADGDGRRWEQVWEDPEWCGGWRGGKGVISYITAVVRLVRKDGWNEDRMLNTKKEGKAVEGEKRGVEVPKKGKGKEVRRPPERAPPGQKGVQMERGEAATKEGEGKQRQDGQDKGTEKRVRKWPAVGRTPVPGQTRTRCAVEVLYSQRPAVGTDSGQKEQLLGNINAFAERNRQSGMTKAERRAKEALQERLQEDVVILKEACLNSRKGRITGDVGLQEESDAGADVLVLAEQME
ncbi:hypothetical protein EV426DRAFT_708102 [Tirmania nivea]|nr:hypothetical protein EV426DRAFT_708102 [Tirmania nivea]